MKKTVKTFWGVLLLLIVSVAMIGCSQSNTETTSEPSSEPANNSSETVEKEPEQEVAFELPNGDITDIVPVAAGGGTDMTHRTLMEASEQFLDKNINVVNVTGAGGSVGFTEAASKKPDGLTIHSYTSEIFTLPIFQQTGYSPGDFEPFMMMNEDPAAIIVPADSEFETLEDFINAAKEKPGEISVGNSGFGNIWHLSASAFAKEAGIELKQVPFDGAAPTLQAALGGHIEAFVASPPEVADQVEVGELSIGTWRGLGVPKGTPEEAVKLLHDAFAKGVEEESFQSFMNERGLTIKYMNTEEFKAFVDEQRPYFEELAKKIAESQ